MLYPFHIYTTRVPSIMNKTQLPLQSLKQGNENERRKCVTVYFHPSFQYRCIKKYAECVTLARGCLNILTREFSY